MDLLALVPWIAAAAACADSLPTPPPGWTTWSQREEIAPRFFVERDAGSGAPILGIAGRGDRSVDGRWVRTVPVAAGRPVSFRAEVRALGVDDFRRSILARAIWLDAAGKQIDQAEYLTGKEEPPAGTWTALEGTYVPPPGATAARIELHLRWAPAGEAVWREPRVEERPGLPSRKVRLAAVNHRPRGGKTARDNLLQFEPLIEEAARRKADVVCLPEGITVCGTPLSYVDAAEPVPGPATEFLGALAARHRLWIAGGIYEREGRTVFNTCVLLDRAGKLAGKYRKTSLPREEIDGGITPGDALPVFDADFGRLGLMICWDLAYPEVARGLSRRGAEVLLLPIWGGEELLARARAVENQVVLVASGYDFRTAIYDRTGKELARSTRDPEVIDAEVDLEARTVWPWLGDWRSRIWHEIPSAR
jgi:predicted amidohydrolase